MPVAPAMSSSLAIFVSAEMLISFSADREIDCAGAAGGAAAGAWALAAPLAAGASAVALRVEAGASVAAGVAVAVPTAPFFDL